MNLFYYMCVSLWLDWIYPPELRPVKQRNRDPYEGYEP